MKACVKYTRDRRPILKVIRDYKNADAELKLCYEGAVPQDYYNEVTKYNEYNKLPKWHHHFLK